MGILSLPLGPLTDLKPVSHALEARDTTCALCDELLFNRPAITSNKVRYANKIGAKVSEPDHMVVAENEAAKRTCHANPNA